MCAALLGAIRDTVKMAELQKRVDAIDNELSILEKKAQTQFAMKQKSQFEVKKELLEEEIKREEEFTHASSFVGTVVYTPELQSMEITLGSRVYPYCGVPQRLFDGFKGAGSKGAFFNRAIKGIYEC